MRSTRTYARLLVYALLFSGACFFSLPFLWMVGTSFKVDRELFAGGLRFFPQAPYPSRISPFIDSTAFEEPDVDLSDPKYGLIREWTDKRLDVPADLPRDHAVAEVAQGLYAKLRRVLPETVWDLDPRPFAARVADVVDESTLNGLLARTHRRLCLGQLRVRSVSLQEEVLGDDVPTSQRFENLAAEVAVLTDRAEKALDYASVNYDFTKGQAVKLSRTFRLGMATRDLQRLQLYMKPDDTWHELHMELDMQGRRYVAERPVPLSNYNWTMVTWQLPGPDDHSTKIKTWVLLKPLGEGTGTVTGDHELKLTLTLRCCGVWHAWWNKLRLNYDRVLDHIPFWRYVRTSLFLVAVNVILTLFSCSLVAYAFARLNWPGRDVCFVLMLATLMIPAQVTMIPHFLIWRSAGAYNTLIPLWLGRAFGNAFFIFLLRQFLRGIPRDLEDAALIDGCGYLRIYWHIMLPLIKPSLAAIAIFTFMGTWNDFMGPLVYIADQRLYPLAFGLYAFSVQVGNNPALTMAGSLLMTLPVIVIFFFAQKYFIQGVTLTGIKG